MVLKVVVRFSQNLKQPLFVISFRHLPETERHYLLKRISDKILRVYAVTSKFWFLPQSILLRQFFFKSDTVLMDFEAASVEETFLKTVDYT